MKMLFICGWKDKKTLSYWKDGQTLNKLPREFIESPSVEKFKNQFETILNSLAGKRVGQDDLKRSLPTLMILW